MKGLQKASKTHAAQAKTLKGVLGGGSKKGNMGKKPKGSDRRLYTDENPRDTVRIKFATPADARATVAKVKRVNKPFARKIQILTVMEQRAKVMGKKAKLHQLLRKEKMQLENVINRLLKFLRVRLDSLSMSVTSGGVDNMENYKYIIGQINAYEATLQEISNLLEDKEQNAKGTVIDINTKQ